MNFSWFATYASECTDSSTDWIGVGVTILSSVIGALIVARITVISVKKQIVASNNNVSKQIAASNKNVAKQIKATAETTSRMRWIEDFRKIVAELLSSISEYQTYIIASLPDFLTEDMQHFKNDSDTDELILTTLFLADKSMRRLKVNMLQTKIELYLYNSNNDHDYNNELILLVHKWVDEILPRKIINPDDAATKEYFEKLKEFPKKIEQLAVKIIEEEKKLIGNPVSLRDN